jgi:hypothetical protein
LFLKNNAKIKMVIFVNIIEPSGAFDKISCIMPMATDVINPAWGERKKILYITKGMVTSGFRNSAGINERIDDSITAQKNPVRIYMDTFISSLGSSPLQAF